MKSFLVFAAFLLTACSSGPAVTLLEGTEADFDELIGGQPAIITFWEVGCEECSYQMMLVDVISEEVQQVKVVGVNLQDSPADALKYWNENELGFPSLLDPKKQISKRFEVGEIAVMLMQSDGTISYRKDGTLGEDEFFQELESLLQVEFGWSLGQEMENSEEEDVDAYQYEAEGDIEGGYRETEYDEDFPTIGSDSSSSVDHQN